MVKLIKINAMQILLSIIFLVLLLLAVMYVYEATRLPPNTYCINDFTKNYSAMECYHVNK